MSSPFNLKEVMCNICNVKEEEIVLKKDTGHIVRCKKCGLYYRTPRLSDVDEINRYRYQTLSNSSLEIVHHSKKQIFISTLNKFNNHKGRILDIGCADGFFLTLSRLRGWEPYGIEISGFLVRKARENLGKNHVLDVPLKSAQLQSNFFDVVTMWDVLDHLADPWGELKEIGKILKKNGLLIIRVRNMSFHMLLNKLFKKNLFGIVKKPTIFHLYGFNNQNIKTLLAKANFSNIKIENSKLTAGDPYSQIKFLESWGINFIKEIYYAFSELISFISGQRTLLSPSIIIYAKKK